MLRNKETLETIEIISSHHGTELINGIVRDIMRFELRYPYEDVVAFFKDGVKLENVQIVTNIVTPEATEWEPDVSTEIVKEVEFVADYSKFNILGDIIKRNNGTISVSMCSKSEIEKECEMLKFRNQSLEADSEALTILLGGTIV